MKWTELAVSVGMAASLLAMPAMAQTAGSQSSGSMNAAGSSTGSDCPPNAAGTDASNSGSVGGTMGTNMRPTPGSGASAKCPGTMTPGTANGAPNLNGTTAPAGGSSGQ